MEKKAYLEIKESVEELKKIVFKQTTLKGEKRIRALQYIKQKKFKTRQLVADSLGISVRTLERWLNKYKSGGIEELLYDKPKNKQSKIITPEIHAGLCKRVYDANNPFLGYKDAQQWVNETYGINVKYQRIREYLKQHFKTKLKSPRKSHYKKDVAAEEAFLKTS